MDGHSSHNGNTSNIIEQPNSDQITVEDCIAKLASIGREELSNEISVLVTIFGAESIACRRIDQYSKTFTISLIASFQPKISGTQEEVTFSIDIVVPEDYPETSPPCFRLVSKYLGAHRVQSELYNKVCALYQNEKECYSSQSVLFDGIESIKEFAATDYHRQAEVQLESQISRDLSIGKDLDVDRSTDNRLDNRSPALPPEPSRIFEIFTSESILDRKSTFVGHATSLTDPRLVSSIMSQILSDKKVSRAAHNMYAWRCEVNGHLHQDNDDDGESAAGSRMQHLLNILDVKNVFVCVSRWFGGIHLGPDRFKHINQATRDALLVGRFISPSTLPSGHGPPNGSKLRFAEHKKH